MYVHARAAYYSESSHCACVHVREGIESSERSHETATYIQCFVPSSVGLSIMYVYARATYCGNLASEAIAHACTYGRATSLPSVVT
jgi:hypothetical protein